MQRWDRATWAVLLTPCSGPRLHALLASGFRLLLELGLAGQSHHVPYLIGRIDTDVLAVEDSVAVGAYGNEVLRRVGLSFLSICKRMQVVDLYDS